jgi:hypothetical protein
MRELRASCWLLVAAGGNALGQSEARAGEVPRTQTATVTLDNQDIFKRVFSREEACSAR